MGSTTSPAPTTSVGKAKAWETALQMKAVLVHQCFILATACKHGCLIDTPGRNTLGPTLVKAGMLTEYASFCWSERTSCLNTCTKRTPAPQLVGVFKALRDHLPFQARQCLHRLHTHMVSTLLRAATPPRHVAGPFQPSAARAARDSACSQEQAPANPLGKAPAVLKQMLVGIKAYARSGLMRTPLQPFNWWIPCPPEWLSVNLKLQYHALHFNRQYSLVHSILHSQCLQLIRSPDWEDTTKWSQGPSSSIAHAPSRTKDTPIGGPHYLHNTVAGRTD